MSALAERSYPPTTVDFNPIIRGVQAANPDIVYVASYPLDSVGIVRAANEIKPEGQTVRREHGRAAIRSTENPAGRATQ